MPLFHADDLFLLRDVGADPGMPACANLAAIDNPDRSADVRMLEGPGLYAAFLDGKLFYIGIYVGAKDKPGSVLERWHKHIVAHTLRARSLFFSAGPFRQFMELEGAPASLYRAVLPENWQERNDIRLITASAYHTTYRKARFATANWHILGPGNEATMLGRMTFGYERLQQPGTSALPHDVIKEQWLKPREAYLIRHFRPICNDGVAIGGERIDQRPWSEVGPVIRQILASPNPFVAPDA